MHTTKIYTLSLHDALPIYKTLDIGDILGVSGVMFKTNTGELSIQVKEFTLLAKSLRPLPDRSEEHTSELQSRGHLVCRLLLEKKKNNIVNELLLIYMLIYI